MKEFIEILKNSIYVTSLVIILILVIEYLNVATKGRKLKNLKDSPWKQVLLGAALGVIPGCMGGFAAVSLFSHNIFNFGALAAAMISDTGDETFIMFAVMPKYALVIKIATFLLAVAAGLIINKTVKNTARRRQHFDHELEIHRHHDDSEKVNGNIMRNIRRMSLTRGLVLSCIFVFALSLAMGLLEHDHDHNHGTHKITETEEIVHEHEDCEHAENHEHTHSHHRHDIGTGKIIFSERWINILFIFVALCAFVMVLATDEHFLKEHIVKHVVHKHLLKVFFWTFGSLLFIYVFGMFVKYDEWMSENQFIMLLIALSIGIIPESGPHIVFISLFMQENIPFSILLANSIVQNGHSGLPLLAESKKSFVKVKLIGIAIAFLVGIAGLLTGF
ncbi:MAG: arsenic efflux protein [Prevotellaceae bacterium]|jgi:hypothetical protein|nr:arsenic efflux protein [Prevotellaceae bacterium]